MTTALSLDTAQRPDGTTVIMAVGEIDQSNVDAFAEALSSSLDHASGDPVVVDLTAVEYLDSAGLAVLFPLADRIRILATPLLGPVLTISGLAELTSIDGIGQ